MKSLDRNTKLINIAYYKGKQKQLLNERQYEVDVWDTPFEYNMNISSPIGEIIVELFGTLEKYDLIGISTNKSLKINENTKFWVNTLPNEALDNNDYIVKNIKTSINSVAIGLVKKVIGNMKDFWIVNGNETPTKVRLSVDINENNTLTVYVKNNDNIDINEETLIWYNKDYDETLTDYNYVVDTIEVGTDITKCIITPFMSV